MNTLSDIDILARTLWGEARGEGLMGMEAVACVILNRQRDDRWPDTIARVCQQPHQFSCWNITDPNRLQLDGLDHKDPAFARAYAIAAMAIAGMLNDRTGNANHYMTTSLFDGQFRPYWAHDANVTTRIGNHVFLKL
jgi:spore germination cell wall hydrolase CwlJ-like protein